MNNFYVYTYADPRNQEIIYVGKGKGNRAYYHITYNYRLNPILRNKLKKFDPIIEIYKDNLTEDEAFLLEKDLIKQYGRIDLGTGTLCNLTEGGEGCVGRIQTEKQRRMNSMKNRGTYEERYGDETALRLKEIRREQMKGNQHGLNISDEGRRKISETHKGKSWEERFGEDYRKARNRCYHIIDPDSNEYIVFSSKMVREFALEKGLPKTSLEALTWKSQKKDEWNGWKCKVLGTEIEFDKHLKTSYNNAHIYKG